MINGNLNFGLCKKCILHHYCLQCFQETVVVRWLLGCSGWFCSCLVWNFSPVLWFSRRKWYIWSLHCVLQGLSVDGRAVGTERVLQDESFPVHGQTHPANQRPAPLHQTGERKQTWDLKGDLRARFGNVPPLKWRRFREFRNTDTDI